MCGNERQNSTGRAGLVYCNSVAADIHPIMGVIPEAVVARLFRAVGIRTFCAGMLYVFVLDNILDC